MLDICQASDKQKGHKDRPGELDLIPFLKALSTPESGEQTLILWNNSNHSLLQFTQVFIWSYGITTEYVEATPMASSLTDQPTQNKYQDGNTNGHHQSRDLLRPF